jgi:uncharacterized protein (TIGR02265 family)
VSFQAPRFDIPPPVEESIAALPKSATCLGLYYNDILETVARARSDVDLLAAADLPKRRYFPFNSYSYADITKLISVAAKTLHPRVAHGEAIRRLGHTAYDRLLGTRVGQAMFGAFRNDVRRILLTGPRGYSLSMNFGKLTADAAGENKIVYHYRKMPALLETYQVGVIEGALRHMQVEGSVRVDMTDVANADVEISWTARSPSA